MKKQLWVVVKVCSAIMVHMHVLCKRYMSVLLSHAL